MRLSAPLVMLLGTVRAAAPGPASVNVGADDTVSGSPDKPVAEEVRATGDVGGVGASGGRGDPARPFAAAALAPRSGQTTTGEATFTMVSDAAGRDVVLVTVKVREATPGDHELLLAAQGDCPALEAQSRRPPGATLGPLRVGSNGEGRLTERVPTADVLGRPLLVDRVACGIVQTSGSLAH